MIVVPAPTSQLPEEREFVVDSGSLMHLLSKKNFELRWNGHSKKSRHPKVVTTANGEVQTFEEAQMYVHDLGLFVTVQLLGGTPAVLSLGTLCEDHGYSHERVSGQKPRLTKEEKTITCKIENNEPLVVPELSANSGSSTSSTSPLRGQSSTDQIEEQREVTAFGNGSGQSTKTPKQKKNKEHRSNADDRLRDLPEWLEPFTDNLEDTETLAPAPVSQDSDSERTTKVAEKLRKHCIFTHFSKSRDCDVCLRTKITRALAEDALAKVYHVQKSLVTW